MYNHPISSNHLLFFLECHPIFLDSKSLLRTITCFRAAIFTMHPIGLDQHPILGIAASCKSGGIHHSLRQGKIRHSQWSFCVPLSTILYSCDSGRLLSVAFTTGTADGLALLVGACVYPAVHQWVSATKSQGLISGQLTAITNG